MDSKGILFLRKKASKPPKQPPDISLYLPPQSVPHRQFPSPRAAAIPIYRCKPLQRKARNVANLLGSRRSEKGVFDTLDILNSTSRENGGGSFELNASSHRAHFSKDSKKPRLDCSMAGHPISLNININNSVVTATNATIVSGENKKLPPRLVSSHIQQKMQLAPSHRVHQSLELTSKDIITTAIKLGKEKQNLVKMGSTTFRTQGMEAKTEGEEVLTPPQVLRMYRNKLTDYEKGEVLDYQSIYFVGNSTEGKEASPSFDDEKGYYNVVIKDHIAFRYEVLQYIGKGSFGQALKCFDHKEKRCVALKLIRSKKKLYHQGTVEVKILKYIRDHDPEHKSCIVKMLDYFVFRKHICITFELLSINLYDFLKNNRFRGVSLGLIRRFAVQLLDSLCFLRKYSIIHCDLKPENVLLENPNKSGIQLIDFGSSCFSNEKVYTYIQSRFYRAPEIMLGIPYTTGIDMWSLGCILGELYTGYPLFPGESEPDQMAMIVETNGPPPGAMLAKAERKDIFFDEANFPLPMKKPRIPRNKSLGEILHCPDEDFVDFVQKCLIWDPEKRITPEEAKEHRWIGGQKKPPTLLAVEEESEKKGEPRKNLSYRARQMNTRGKMMTIDSTEGKLNASLSGAEMNLNASFASNGGSLHQTHRVDLHNKLCMIREKLIDVGMGDSLNQSQKLNNNSSISGRMKRRANLLLKHTMNRNVLLPLLVHDSFLGTSNKEASMQPS